MDQMRCLKGNSDISIRLLEFVLLNDPLVEIPHLIIEIIIVILQTIWQIELYLDGSRRILSFIRCIVSYSLAKMLIEHSCYTG